MNVYDTIAAHQIEKGDQILVNGQDPLEVTDKKDLTTAILVVGYSHDSGDEATYLLDPDKEISLWSV